MGGQMAINASRKELASGGIFVAFGAYFALESLNYEIGTAFRMGPAFMPLLLGSALAALGLAIAANGLRKPDEEAAPPIPWRGMALALGTIIFFGATIRGLGFIPVVFVSATATALASRHNSPLFAAILGVALTVLCTLIFVIGLGLNVAWVGPWLRFQGA
jgi:hypothetical protein